MDGCVSAFAGRLAVAAGDAVAKEQAVSEAGI